MNKRTAAGPMAGGAARARPSPLLASVLTTAVGAVVAGTVMTSAAAAVLAGPQVVGAHRLGPGSMLAGGLIAFRDVRGIGVLNPTDGHQLQVLNVPPGCLVGHEGLPVIQLGGPDWAATKGGPPELYFWLTDWGLKNVPGCDLPAAPAVLSMRPVLIEANPATGSSRVAAVVPADLPCEPGTDISSLPGRLAFTNDGCDESSVLSVALPLRSQPRQARPGVPPDHYCNRCAVGLVLLGPGPEGRFLTAEWGTQVQHPPAPSLQWFNPVTGNAGALSPTPPVPTVDITSAAASPNGAGVAFAAEKAGVGVLDLKTGSWTPERMPPCSRACDGAWSISWSPDGTQLALAADGSLVVDQAAGASTQLVFLHGAGVDDVSWSGPITPAAMAPSRHPVAFGAAMAEFARSLRGKVPSGGQKWTFP